MSHPVTPDSVTKRKAMYKMGSPAGGSWKDTYKRRCAERLHKSRSKLLDRYRNVKIDSENSEHGLDSVDSVMKQELEKMKSEGMASFNDMSSFEDVINTMEAIKGELLEWEAEILLKAENEQMQLAIECHENHETLFNNNNFVICPLCSINHLELSYTHLQCKCGLNINTQQDSISLPHIKQSLEEAVTSHSATCTAKPVFDVINNFGQTNLLLTCPLCDYMFIVV
uniref:RPA-interacting protein C-terminal domain-containing protein n=1 Tax=Ciona savignyi TaxID=51511 RepID=H2ZBP7_CIOSA